MVKIARFQWQSKATWGIVEGEDIFSLKGNIYDEFDQGSRLCQLGDVKLMAPAESRITIACGMNYMDHIKELGWDVPKQPALFYKPLHTIIGPEDDVIYPKFQELMLRRRAVFCHQVSGQRRDRRRGTGLCPRLHLRQRLYHSGYKRA